jgi:sugar/nucleoside kinase (ribokinase family)
VNFKLRLCEVKDAAGSGDWCTSGLLDKLARGLSWAEEASAEQLREAVRHGQALAAWNCGFEGARGACTSWTSRSSALK